MRFVVILITSLLMACSIRTQPKEGFATLTLPSFDANKQTGMIVSFIRPKYFGNVYRFPFGEDIQTLYVRPGHYVIQLLSCNKAIYLHGSYETPFNVPEAGRYTLTCAYDGTHVPILSLKLISEYAP